MQGHVNSLKVPATPYLIQLPLSIVILAVLDHQLYLDNIMSN
jgi:hypothetical protein